MSFIAASSYISLSLTFVKLYMLWNLFFTLALQDLIEMQISKVCSPRWCLTFLSEILTIVPATLTKWWNRQGNLISFPFQFISSQTQKWIMNFFNINEVNLRYFRKYASPILIVMQKQFKKHKNKLISYASNWILHKHSKTDRFLYKPAVCTENTENGGKPK